MQRPNGIAAAFAFCFAAEEGEGAGGPAMGEGEEEWGGEGVHMVVRESERRKCGLLFSACS